MPWPERERAGCARSVVSTFFVVGSWTPIWPCPRCKIGRLDYVLRVCSSIWRQSGSGNRQAFPRISTGMLRLLSSCSYRYPADVPER